MQLTPEDIIAKLSSFMLVMLDHTGLSELTFTPEELDATQGRHIKATMDGSGTWRVSERKEESAVPEFELKVQAEGRVINPGDPGYEAVKALLPKTYRIAFLPVPE